MSQKVSRVQPPSIELQRNNGRGRTLRMNDSVTDALHDDRKELARKHVGLSFGRLQCGTLRDWEFHDKTFVGVFAPTTNMLVLGREGLPERGAG